MYRTKMTIGTSRIRWWSLFLSGSSVKEVVLENALEGDKTGPVRLKLFLGLENVQKHSSSSFENVRAKQLGTSWNTLNITLEMPSHWFRVGVDGFVHLVFFWGASLEFLEKWEPTWLKESMSLQKLPEWLFWNSEKCILFRIHLWVQRCKFHYSSWLWRLNVICCWDIYSRRDYNSRERLVGANWRRKSNVWRH